MQRIITLSAALSLILTAHAADRTVSLLDADLSRFEIWMGIPHSSVTGLPEGTYQSDKVTEGTPMGLNSDVKNVFSIIEEDGETVLKITGEIYAGLTTLNTFSNYHFKTEFRWGEKKWPPRLNQKRDSGILYHCHGKHGSFWNVWKSCLEYQVQESDLGDFIPLAGPSAAVRSVLDGNRPKYDPAADYQQVRNYTSAGAEPDAPHGEWNTLELYVIGARAIHVVNGQVVLALKDAQAGDGTPLTKGQIQIQSEAAECYYKNMTIEPIEAFPETFLEAAAMKGDEA